MIVIICRNFLLERIKRIIYYYKELERIIYFIERTKYLNLIAINFRKVLRKYICLMQGEVIKYLLKYKMRDKTFV